MLKHLNIEEAEKSDKKVFPLPGNPLTIRLIGISLFFRVDKIVSKWFLKSNSFHCNDSYSISSTPS